jgi:hypothetical protein
MVTVTGPELPETAKVEFPYLENGIHFEPTWWQMNLEYSYLEKPIGTEVLDNVKTRHPEDDVQELVRTTFPNKNVRPV